MFLDRNLAIKSFTPAAKDLFRLVESDTGRPITHVRARFQSDNVQEEAERVLRTLSTIERQVESNDTDPQFIMRMMPYRTVDNVIGGVVVTFVDITRITAAETRIGELTSMRNRVQSLETLLNLLPVGILIVEDDRTDPVRLNRYGAQLLGENSRADDGAGLRPSKVALRVFQDERELGPSEQPLYRAAHSGQSVPAFEADVMRADGRRISVMMSATPMFDDQGKVRGGIAAILDISERRVAEAHQRVLLYELQHRVKNIITTIGALASRMMKDSRSLEEFSPAFLGRLRAMAGRTSCFARQLDRRQLARPDRGGAPVASRQRRDDGGPARSRPHLDAGAASTLGLVFYELATNATKYGSLSADGKVAIAWRVDGPPELGSVVIDWIESGGPSVNGPIEPGFGASFVTRSIEYELNGTAEVQPDKGGLRWMISFPLQRNVQRRTGH